MSQTDALLRSLFERMRGRDEAALRELVAQQGAQLLRIARALTHDQARAEDAVQETLLAVWSARGELPPHPRAWLLTVLRNAVSRQYRGAAHAGREDASLETLGAEAGWSCPERLDQTLKRVEDRDAIDKALSCLSAADREVLGLVDGESLSLDETARMLGVEVGAVKSRVHRARLRFIAALGRQEVPHER